MKAFIILLAMALTVAAGHAAIIIDHTCTDISKIPSSRINAAKNQLRISYGHTSHGSQLITGMTVFENDYGSLYNFNTGGAVSSGVLSIADRTPSGDLGNPDFVTWEARTRTYLNGSGSDRNVVMWSWCGQVNGASSANINTYLSLMNGLEQDYPDVTFVYMTGHLEGTGTNGNLNRRNNQIRDYCRANNKVLFDFADIESYDPDGDGYLALNGDDGLYYYLNGDRRNWGEEWTYANPGHELTRLTGLCGSCAHSHRLNCILKGGAAWWLFARIAGWNGNGGTPQPSITVTSPNGGENWKTGSSHNVTWSSTGAVGSVRIDYSLDNGGGWNAVTTSTANDGSFSWTLPDDESTQCLVRVYETDGSPSDTCNGTFTIYQPDTGTPGLTVTSPNGGESWNAGAAHKITWSSTGAVGALTLQYSVDNGGTYTTINASTSNDGSYHWTVPDTPSGQCIVRIYETSDGSPSDVSDAVFSIVSNNGGDPPSILLNRERLNFGYIKHGAVPGSQSFSVSNGGGGTLSWTAESNVDWLSLTDCSCTGGGTVTVDLDPTGLSTGNYTGAVSVTAAEADNSPQTLTVYLCVKDASQDAAPIGSLDTPQGDRVYGSVPFTGWVLDDVEVDGVQIFYQDGGKLVYVGDAVMVEGARPDIAAAYPDHPANTKAGWGYMMLTLFLPGQGNGTFTFHAVAGDCEGNTATLGTKTVTIDNAGSVQPFGAIDTPQPGAGASGAGYLNYGWALTPSPNSISTDGSTIDVYVDGVKLGHPAYNLYRPDIAGLFPGYANSNGAVGLFHLDTTAYSDGVHTIEWAVTDSAGNTEGIGSRYFEIRNAGVRDQGSGVREGVRDQGRNGLGVAPGLDPTPVTVLRGFNAHAVPEQVYPDTRGIINIEISQLERLELHLPPEHSLPPITKRDHAPRGLSLNAASHEYRGYSTVDSRLQPLPIGSTLDTRRGVFSWLPGPGFLGEYRLVFFRGNSKDAPLQRKEIIVNVRAGY